MSITRRDFAKASAAGLATLSLRPHLFAQAAAPQRKIGYAIIGIGRIADHFLRGSRLSQTSAITGLVSGHRDKAERTAAEYNVPTSSIYSYEDFDKIANDKSIQAVYVALPNSMHAEYTIRAARAGKHVLCEKPMAINPAECEKMIAACKENHVKLMIAYRLHYEPITRQLQQIIRDGRLGRIQTLEGSNGFNIAQHEWRTQKAMAGGGAMFDVGIYCLNAYRYFTGEECNETLGYISTRDKDDPRFKDIEESITWTMRFPSGIVATGGTSYGASLQNNCVINGSKGSIVYGGYGYEGQSIKGRCAISGEPGAPVVEIQETNTEKDPMQFVRQMDHFSRCIMDDKTPDTPGEEGLADLRLIANIYKSANQPL